ncbi:MAG: hypothetical protein L0Y73_08835, partial [Candidatus Aminicenantes bacterium]|nr:hypothetical protein [Candidatus Aminicenantes bacterium]
EIYLPIIKDSIFRFFLLYPMLLYPVLLTFYILYSRTIFSRSTPAANISLLWAYLMDKMKIDNTVQRLYNFR